MQDERWLLVDKQVQQASQHGGGAIDAQVCGLAKEGQMARLGS
tara:strand:+ start:1996 stop:2124 length:129 start_codon:yes stop_codon:yes gene_type:complete